MITLTNDRLEVRFPHLNDRISVVIDFERTLRVPGGRRASDLPPGRGRLPLRHIEDYHLGASEHRKERGGIIMPVLQSEAVRLNFRSSGRGWERPRLPVAIKIGTGMVNVLSGRPWEESFSQNPQNHVVCPAQTKLDGFAVPGGGVRQFVAMPLGQGRTAEGHVDPRSNVGGIQVEAVPLKLDVYERLAKESRNEQPARVHEMGPLAGGRDTRSSEISSIEMELGAGEMIWQEIQSSKYLRDDWDQEKKVRCFVMLLNSQQWMSITGDVPPIPITGPEEYREIALTWEQKYGGDDRAIKGLKSLKIARSCCPHRNEHEIDCWSDNTLEMIYETPADYRLMAAFFPVEIREVYTESREHIGLFDLLDPLRYAIVDVERKYCFALVADLRRLITNRLAYEIVVYILRKIFSDARPEDILCRGVSLSSNRAICHIEMFVRQEVPAHMGDMWEMSLRITNSYKHNHALHLEWGFYRQICSNGMMAFSPVSQFKLHPRRNLGAQLKKIIEKFGSPRVFRSTLAENLNLLSGYPVYQDQMLAIVCHTFGVEATPKGQIKTSDYLRDLQDMCDTVEALADSYFRELGSTGYAALNVLTELATRPVKAIEQANQRNDLQMRASEWTEEFIHLHKIHEGSFSFDKFLGDYLSTAKWINHLNSLNGYTVRQDQMLAIVCRTFGVEIASEDQIKCTDYLRGLRGMCDTVEALADSYFHELGSNGYAALNVLTELAKRPVKAIGQANQRNDLQRRASKWAEEFIYLHKFHKRSFCFDKYLGDFLSTAKRIKSL